MTFVPTYGHQVHIIENSFNKCTGILVQVKYQKLNDDDLHYRSPSQSVTYYYSPNLIRK